MIPKKPKATRAKCKICNTIASSYFETDRASCVCGEIAVIGGSVEMYKANNWDNLIVLDDSSDTPAVQTKDEDNKKQDDPIPDEVSYALTRAELLDELRRMIEGDTKLPDNAHIQHLTYYDLLRYMVVILDILKKEGKE